MFKIVEENYDTKTKKVIGEFETNDEAQKKLEKLATECIKSHGDVFDTYLCPFEFWADTSDGEFTMTIVEE